jgi:hypothetical protein
LTLEIKFKKRKKKKESVRVKVEEWPLNDARALIP